METSIECSQCNLVVVSIDTLRADRLSAYGYHRPTSPSLEALASEGALFENFFHSGGGTLPSHLTMFTSLNPGTHGISPANPVALPESRRTLAEHLRAANYATAAFTDGGWMAGEFGFKQGFELYDDTVTNGHLAVTLPKARAWIEEHAGVPFFLFLHTYDVHSTTQGLPYGCPGEYANLYVGEPPAGFDGCRAGRCASELLAEVNRQILAGEIHPDEAFSPDEIRFISSLYDGCINYADARLGELIGFLRDRGLWDETVFVVVSDHGEEFLDHGLLLHHQGGFEELSRVPLVLRTPRFEGGVRVTHLGAMIDLFPTLAELLGLDPPQAVQGRSLVPAMTAGARVRSEVHIRGVLRTPRWSFFAKTGALHDLETPGELVDVSAENPEVAARLRRRLAELLRADREAAAAFESEQQDDASEVLLSDEERRGLEALGYID